MVDGAAGGWKPALCVVVSEVFNTGTILLSKVAIDWGTFVFSLLLYRSILGAVFTLPFALFFERSDHYLSFMELKQTSTLHVTIDSNKSHFCSGKWKHLDKRALGWLFLNALAGYLNI